MPEGVSSAPVVANHRALYTKVTLGSLVAIGIAAIPVNVVEGIEGAQGQNPGIILVVSLVVAGLVWGFGRWLHFLAVLVGVGAWLLFSARLQYGAASFESFFFFAPAVIILVAGFIAFICGPVAFFQSRRPSPRASPTGLEVSIFGIVTVVVVGLVIASGIVSIVGRSSVSAAERVGAIVLLMEDTEFKPDRLIVPASQKVTLVVDNADLMVHTLTIEDLDLSHALAGRSSKLIELPELQPGQYEYTSTAWGDEDMKGTLVVEE